MLSGHGREVRRSEGQAGVGGKFGGDAAALGEVDDFFDSHHVEELHRRDIHRPFEGVP